MMKITRAFDIETGDGRTLEGWVWRTGVPSTVADTSHPEHPGTLVRYTERYSESAVFGHEPVALRLAHPQADYPGLDPRADAEFGTVEFTPAGDGLRFTARLADDEYGEAARVMLSVGGLTRAVSWGGSILKAHVSRNDVWRDEVRIDELSLLPNGQKGALKGAQIEVVRNAIEIVPSRLLRHRLKLALLS